MLDKFILPHDDGKQTHLGFVIADYDKSINKNMKENIINSLEP